MDARDQAREELLRAIVDLGYPVEFGAVVAAELRGEKSMSRMAGYLRSAKPASMEDIADEMLAIAAERDRWIDRKTSEHANASITEFYNRPREPENDDGPR